MVLRKLYGTELVWMLCSRQANKMINTLRERALRIVCNDHTSDLGTLHQGKQMIDMPAILVHKTQKVHKF